MLFGLLSSLLIHYTHLIQVFLFLLGLLFLFLHFLLFDKIKSPFPIKRDALCCQNCLFPVFLHYFALFNSFLHKKRFLMRFLLLILSFKWFLLLKLGHSFRCYFFFLQKCLLLELCHFFLYFFCGFNLLVWLNLLVKWHLFDVFLSLKDWIFSSFIFLRHLLDSKFNLTLILMYLSLLLFLTILSFHQSLFLFPSILFLSLNLLELWFNFVLSLPLLKHGLAFFLRFRFVCSFFCKQSVFLLLCNII